MKNLFFVSTIIFIVIVPKISYASQNEAVETNNEKISIFKDRAKRLYACSNYFHIVSTQRKKQDEIKRYKALALSTKILGERLLNKFNVSQPLSDITSEYEQIGNDEAIKMVKEIGLDKTNKKFSQITISCYKDFQKEDLVKDITSIKIK
jgi:hypothetical protein